jgi:hypothetical protein
MLSEAPVSGRRSWRVIGGLWAVSVLVAVGVVVVARAETPAGPEDHGHGAIVVSRQVLDLDNGGGTVELLVSAPRSESGGVKAGTPVTLAFALDGEPANEMPGLDAVIRPSATPDSSVEVDLNRAGTAVVNTATGELLLMPGEGNGHEDHSGSGLSRLAGGAAEWAATLAPGGDVASGADGRWMVVSNPDSPTLDVVDLLRRSTGQVRTPISPTSVRVEDGTDRAWVIGGGAVAVVDLLSGSLNSTEVTGSPADVAFAPSLGLALVTDAESTSAQLVDVTSLEVVSSVDLGVVAGPVVFAPDPGVFVVAGADGRLVVVSGDDAATVSVSTLSGAASSGDVALAAASGHPRVAVVDRAAGVLNVVDLNSVSVVGSQRVTAAPTDVVMLNEFAIVADATELELTWVDLAEANRSGEMSIAGGVAGKLSADLAGEEVLIPIAADKRLQRVHMMMGRPMIMQSDATGTNADVAVASSSTLVQLNPTTWQLRTVLSEDGSYELTLRIADGSVTFPIEVDGDGPSAVVTGPAQELAVAGDSPVTVDFAVSGAEPDKVQVLAYGMLETGPFQSYLDAERVGDRYVTSFDPPQPGDYEMYALPGEDFFARSTLVATVVSD